jgi:hypothetical protein
MTSVSGLIVAPGAATAVGTFPGRLQREIGVRLWDGAGLPISPAHFGSHGFRPTVLNFYL